MDFDFHYVINRYAERDVPHAAREMYLDPATDVQGIAPNRMKTWAGIKAAKAYTIRVDLRS